MRYEVQLEGRTALLEIEATDGGWRYRVDDDEGRAGPWQQVQGRFTGPGELQLRGASRLLRFGGHARGDHVTLQVDGHALDATVVDPRRARADLAGSAAEGVIKTPMPGVVVRVPVQVGQQVHAGQVVVVVEAMKMENEFKAPTDGVVAELLVQPGQALEGNALLARIEPD